MNKDISKALPRPPYTNILEIAVNKAYTIGQRGTWRDYVDLFFLLKGSYVTLDQVIKESEKRFTFEFNTKLFLQQMVYTKDINDFKIEYLKEKYEPKEIADFLTKKLISYTSKITG